MGSSPSGPPEQKGWFSNATMQKNWELFKHRNPNTVSQVRQESANQFYQFYLFQTPALLDSRGCELHRGLLGLNNKGQELLASSEYHMRPREQFNGGPTQPACLSFSRHMRT